MRLALEQLATPHPVLDTLPGIYRDGQMVAPFLLGFDAGLAPVVNVLDNFAAYLDVSTTPDDFVPWLALWLGITVDPNRAADRQREVLRLAGRLHGLQGTRSGIELAVQAIFDVEAVVLETGGTAWSLDPGAPLPGRPDQAFVVQVRPAAGQETDLQRVDDLVASMKPAHVVHRVELMEGAA